jgi:hypothetical protein
VARRLGNAKSRGNRRHDQIRRGDAFQGDHDNTVKLCFQGCAELERESRLAYPTHAQQRDQPSPATNHEVTNDRFFAFSPNESGRPSGERTAWLRWLRWLTCEVEPLAEQQCKIVGDQATEFIAAAEAAIGQTVRLDDWQIN